MRQGPVGIVCVHCERAEMERAVATEAVLRRMNIKKVVLKTYGSSAGCLWCQAWLTGRSLQGRSVSADSGCSQG